ncbi:MAG: SUF system NifU family Fe-S cluster assembly protein [Pseudomonadota bacterium]|nr:SUF system NifU family Fe-S cluster assembly protein [Pseudomonadota bacterium]HJO36761.1 SUF system NifU family Fe-S cluster assembly protein [Gammaproteobacteria bacterium]
MELKDLYQDIIVDHNRSPRNFHALEPADRTAEGYNPLCGDKLKLFLRLRGDVIEEAAFLGSGCAISTASTSLMTERLKGMRIAEAEALFGQMHRLLTGEGEVDLDQLGKLAALSGVKDYPARVKCASLCWHTLNSALHGSQSATTE